MLLNETRYKVQQKIDMFSEHMYEHRSAAIYLLTLMCVQTRNVYAASDPFVIFGNIINGLYVKLVALATGVALLCTLVLCLKRMPADRQEKAIISSNIKDVWLTWAFVNMFGSIYFYAKTFINDDTAIKDLSTLS